jgi:peptidoglycan/LPS O-acetylase OafA/YrhL
MDDESSLVLPAAGKLGQVERFTSLFRGAIRDLSQRPRGNVPGLDVLRTAAILLVFGGHFAAEFHASPKIASLPFFYWGWTGVDLFFVLSGILIGGQLWKELRASGSVQIGKFLLRRGLRIWPLYYALWGFLAAEVIVIHRPFSGMLADAFFLSNYFHSQIGGGWSLSTEEQFYIFAPVSIFVLSKWLKPAWLWTLPAAGCVVLPMLRFLLSRGSPLNLWEMKQKMYFPFHTHSDGLALGLLIAWVAAFYPQRMASTFFRLRVSVVLAAMGAALWLFNPVVFNFSALASVYGALAFFIMAMPSVGKLLGWQGFYVVSRLSYGMYLNHFGLLPRLATVFGKWCPPEGPLFWFWYLVSMLVCLAFSVLTFQLIEWPFLRIRASWMKAMTAQNPAARQINQP